MNAKDRRAARHLPPSGEADTKPRRRKNLITPEQIVDTALDIISSEGYEALTMRRIATALETGPASLYAHVVNKADLDELLIGRVCAQLDLPEPDPTKWRDQIRDVCVQLREQYLKYPGISRAALALAPTDLEILRVNEGMLAIMIAGGIEAQKAAWGIDALMLYVGAYCLEVSISKQRADRDDLAWVVDPAELQARLQSLPADRFPHLTRHAAELTAGAGHARCDFTVDLLINSLV